MFARTPRASTVHTRRAAPPFVLVLLALALCASAGSQRAMAQEGPRPAAPSMDEAERRAAEALAAPTDDPQAAVPAPAAQRVNLLELWVKGGVLMIPITFMSLVVVVFAVERLLGLRRRRVIPPKLVAGLGQLAAKPGGLDPRAAYRLCQQYPSAGANVFRAVLLKVGRPHSEVERAVTDSSEIEAAKLYKNVRPLTLAAAITPLLGLLGTVQGMIYCFYDTANMPAGVNRTQTLAEGIYVALVTTFGGLIVAIPAAVLAHYFEGRIQSLFREIHELLGGLLPQLERFEGRLRPGAGDAQRAATTSPGREAVGPASASPGVVSTNPAALPSHQ